MTNDSLRLLSSNDLTPSWCDLIGTRTYLGLAYNCSCPATLSATRPGDLQLDHCYTAKQSSSVKLLGRRAAEDEGEHSRPSKRPRTEDSPSSNSDKMNGSSASVNGVNGFHGATDSHVHQPVASTSAHVPLYSGSAIDKTEFVKLTLQALEDIGYS